MKIPELVVPAGSPDKLKAALDYGADAVYLSGKQFGLRNYADNFDNKELETAVKEVKERGKKVYVAVNAFCRNNQLHELETFFIFLSHLAVDAVIVSDPGVIRLVQKICPHIPVHLSTQANTTNYESVLFWRESGVKRIILARELSMHEIKEIADQAPLELELFVHGALCMAYAGKCYLSAYLEGRESNQGMCAQICRREFAVMQTEDDGTYMPIEFDLDTTYIFNQRDLCLIEFLPRIVQMGIDAIKIEGRMKTVYYVAAVTRIYREALDILKHDEVLTPELLELFRKELNKVSNRGYTAGFFDPDFARKSGEMVETEGKYVQLYQFLGIINTFSGTQFSLNPKNKIAVGDLIEVLGFSRKNDCEAHILKIIRDNGECAEVHPNQWAEITLDRHISSGTIIRKKLIEADRS